MVVSKIFGAKMNNYIKITDYLIRSMAFKNWTVKISVENFEHFLERPFKIKHDFVGLHLTNCLDVALNMYILIGGGERE